MSDHSKVECYLFVPSCGDNAVLIVFLRCSITVSTADVYYRRVNYVLSQKLVPRYIYGVTHFYKNSVMMFYGVSLFRIILS